MSKLKQTLFSLKDADRKVIEEKLKEKDKEIERLNTIKNNAIECADLFKVALSVRQKDLAIQELEKVKEEFGLKSGWSSETDMCFDLEQFIKQQIKELKGQDND